MKTSRSRHPEQSDPKSRPEAPVVHSITAAAQSHSADLDMRIRRYLISMGIRTVCFILVLVIHSPVRWVFAVLALVLPYIAVVMANAAGARRRGTVPAVPMIRLPLNPTAAAAPGPSGGPKSDLISDASPERTN